MQFRLFGQGNILSVFFLVFLLVFIGTFVQFKFVRLEENAIALEAKIVRLQNANNAFEDAKRLAQKKRSYDIVVYNRVPKTASTSFVNVAYDLCKRNGYNVLHLNVTGNLHVMSIADQARFVYNVTHWEAKKPGLYHGHVAFIDFEKFGPAQKPIYINLLRKPLDRLISYYYFLRFGDNYRPHLTRRKHGDKMTFDECVNQRHPDCNPENMWLQIPFLCGHMPECWEPGNQWALDEAKRNLVSRYLLVGVTEQLSEFIAVLEAALPTFFKGATQHFKTSKKKHLRKTNQKLQPKQETISWIQKSKIWQMETELYEYALTQFESVKKRMGQSKEGLPYDVGQMFMYEKISPKKR